MPMRFDDIGNRLKAFRLGSGMSAEDVAKLIESIDANLSL